MYNDSWSEYVIVHCLCVPDLQCSVNSSAILVAIFCESISHTTTTCSFDGRPAHQCKNTIVRILLLYYMIIVITKKSAGGNK